MASLIFSRRISSFFSLLLISFIAFVLGTIIIVKSKELKKLETPLIFDYETGEIIKISY